VVRLKSFFDHLVFGVSSLDVGARWLEERLGVPLAPGGEHLKMGTHNRLLRLGQSSYLELIAISPLGEKPGRPRWFALDAVSPEDLVTPRLLTWVASTPNISKTADQADYHPGGIQAMIRNSLNWLITIPDDGSLVAGGLLPSLIEWPAGVHPSQLLPERGLYLKELELYTPDPMGVERSLESIGVYPAVNHIRILPDDGGTRLRACLATKHGAIWFDSPDSTGNRVFPA
jgi:hypothetical protein